VPRSPISPGVSERRTTTKRNVRAIELPVKKRPSGSGFRSEDSDHLRRKASRQLREGSRKKRLGSHAEEPDQPRCLGLSTGTGARNEYHGSGVSQRPTGR